MPNRLAIRWRIHHDDEFDAERGEAHCRQTLMAAEPRDTCPLVALCHLGLGKLYRRAGNRYQALECLTTATAMYSDVLAGAGGVGKASTRRCRGRDARTEIEGRPHEQGPLCRATGSSG